MITHRKRRVAADEAHSWARHLRLKNPYGKLVLGMLTLYVNGEGSCFVGIQSLAEDCELSADTVRKRLAWLEHVGAIARFPQWIDGNGRRNGDGVGKRTSDEIRLLMEADPDVIEARAAGDEHAGGDDDGGEISPRSQQGLNEAEDQASPPVAVCQPSDSGKGLKTLNLNTEPEDSPQPPKGGNDDAGGEAEGKPWPHEASWQRIEAAWGNPILHQQLCRTLWDAFSDPERERFARVVRGYLSWRVAQPKPPNRCNMQKLMRERDAWPGFEKLAGPDPTLRTFIAEGSAEHRAFTVIEAIGGWSARPCPFDTSQGARGYWRSRPTLPDELAMAQFVDKPFDQWTQLEPKTPSFYAWVDRVRDWTGVHRENLRVPCLFPPRKDGTISSSTDPPKESSAA